MKKNAVLITCTSILSILLVIAIITFSMSIGITSVPGEQGPQGEPGIQGEKGEDGQNGQDGQDGLTPFVGENGTWWIGDVDTGITAQGIKGEDGTSVAVKASADMCEIVGDGYIDANGNLQILTDIDNRIFTNAGQIKGPQGEKGEDGADGLTPYIGTNGNWWVGNIDSGVKAQGKKGDTGAQGEKGDTGATGETGATGAKGDKGDKGDKGADGEDGERRYRCNWSHRSQG